MQKEMLIDLVKKMMHSEKVRPDDFFPNEMICEVEYFSQANYDVFYRQISNEETKVITEGAFHMLLFWLKNGEITIDIFERFLAILVFFSAQIFTPVDEESLPAMLEMMSLVDYKDHAICKTIQMYINSPDLLRKQMNLVH